MLHNVFCDVEIKIIAGTTILFTSYKLIIIYSKFKAGKKHADVLFIPGTARGETINWKENLICLHSAIIRYKLLAR